MKLLIKFKTDDDTEKLILSEFYSNHECNYKEDSGLDLVCTKEVTIKAGETGKIGLGISCQPVEKAGYFLFPRSSIYKTPLRLANSAGIIDMNYRGEIMAVVDNIKKTDYTVKAGDRLFQLCGADLKPIKFELVENLDETSRGENGFGSTNYVMGRNNDLVLGC